MIFGIGTDCVRIERIRKLLNQFDEKAIKRIFTETEIKRAEKSTCEENKIRTYAKRFSAKEAFSKALGTGIGIIEFCCRCVPLAVISVYFALCRKYLFGSDTASNIYGVHTAFLPVHIQE